MRKKIKYALLDVVTVEDNRALYKIIVIEEFTETNLATIKVVKQLIGPHVNANGRNVFKIGEEIKDIKEKELTIWQSILFFFGIANDF